MTPIPDQAECGDSSGTAMDYLIVTNQRDITSDFIVQEMQRRRLRYHRLNTETIPQYSVAFDPTSESIVLTCGSLTFDIGGIRAAYFRRPEQPADNLLVSDLAEREYCTAEWNAVLKSIYLLIGQRWLSHPSDILLAEDKPRQLRLAKQVGLISPSTLITSNFELARAFVSDGHCVGKPMKHALLDGVGNNRVIFTNRMDKLSPQDQAAIAACPVIFQREVPKQFDIRVTVVGEHVFSVAIHSQSSPETTVDWRRGSNPTLEHEIITLPEELNAACVALVKKQNLRFGAIDLVLSTEGQYFFLECNPNGQWAWIENRTGLPIAAAIVDELQGIAQQ